MNAFCPFCEKETAIEKIIATEEMDVRDLVIPVEREYYRCASCGEEFEVLEEDYDPYAAAYREYRRRKGWVQPEEIKEFRESLGLTQKQFSDLLGIGIATLNRYENGALQSEANNQLIQLCIENPWTLLTFARTNPAALSDYEIENLTAKIEESQVGNHRLLMAAINRYGAYPPSILSGDKAFDFNKLREAIRFFCYDEEVFKTKLLKLLFYADFKSYKEHGVSITGAQYARLPLGPVPDKYDTWLAACTDWLNIVTSELREIGEYTGEVFFTDKKPDQNLFEPEEIEILGVVKNKFIDFTATDIKDFSHQEKGYKETPNSQIISYSYAKELKI